MKCLISLVALLAGSAIVRADNWPAWRGPTGQGFCAEKDVPLQWGVKENFKWKVPLANPGNSTPVVWGDKIFLTQAIKGGTERSLLCFARADGKLLWQKDVAYPDKEKNWDPNWYCNASPAVDGDRVVVSFASAGVFCFDHDGKELWKRTDLGKWEHQFGNGASPVLYGDLAIQWCGPNEEKGCRNFLLAMNKATGKTAWEHVEKLGSWGTPLVAKVDGKDQLMLSLVPHLKGLDPKTGKELWKCEGLDKYVYTSPLFGNGVAVAMSGYTGTAIGVKLGGEGDIIKDRLWQQPKATQRVGSGMIVGDHVYIMEENGVPHCYDLKSGAETWKVDARPGHTVTWGSMVHAEGRLYVLMRNAETLVFNADPKEFKLLATNKLNAGEQTNSSLAISNGDIFIRTQKSLWCVGGKK